MLKYLINTCYLLLLTLISPFLLTISIRKGKYREGWAAKLLGHVPQRRGSRPCIWFHAVSVGEIQLLDGLIRHFRGQAPGIECVISTTTQTGYALARKKYPDHLVFYCPLDFSWSVHEALNRLRPDMLVLAELELWPNLISLAHRQGVRIAVVNGRLSDQSFRGYRRIRPLVARMLRSLELIAVQNSQYARRFVDLGADPDRVTITGSMKFDGASTDRNNPNTSALAAVANFDADDVIFLAGSTQRPEERLAIDAFSKLCVEHPELRLILVPRHPERFDEVAQLLDDRGLQWQRRSQLGEPQLEKPLSSEPGSSVAEPRILLVDTVGELGDWWGTAHLGFVGGSLGSRGGQNMIEPAAYGVATCFGPNTSNFRDIVTALIAAKAAVVVEDAQDLETFVRHCLEQPKYAGELAANARELVADNLGATERTVHRLLEILDKPCQQHKAA